MSLHILEKSKNEPISIALVNCKVQESKYDSSLEIVTSEHTKVECSVDKVQASCSTQEVVLDKMSTLAVNQHISVIAKAVKVDEATEVT